MDMKEQLKPVSQAFEGTSDGLDGIIEALRRHLPPEPPPPPPNPKTVVTYLDETVQEYLIEGELGQNSIPNKDIAAKVEIGNSVTSIGVDAFANSGNLLTLITIPDSVTSIGNQAFFNCSGLTSITIPDGVTNIGAGAFYGCVALTSLIIGNSVASIGGFAFTGCSGLTSITIPDSITSIGDQAFYSCSGLTSITCRATIAPTVQSETFGSDTSSYTGYPTSGDNVLKVPQGATGYETTGTAWKDTLLNSTRCGFHIVYE